MLAAGFDPGIGCVSQDARILFLLGYPERAEARAAERSRSRAAPAIR